MRNKIHFIGSQCFNKRSQDLAYQQERLSRRQFPSQWPINSKRFLWCRFQKCLGTFTILLVEASSEMGLFRHLSDYVFGVRNFENTKSMRVILFFKMLKISTKFQECSKKFRKIFLFLRWLHVNSYFQIVSIKNRILFIGSQCFNKTSQDLAC